MKKDKNNGFFSVVKNNLIGNLLSLFFTWYLQDNWERVIVAIIILCLLEFIQVLVTKLNKLANLWDKRFSHYYRKLIRGKRIILFILILAGLSNALAFKYFDLIVDNFHGLTKSKDKTYVIIPDFDSFPEEEGKRFADDLEKRLKSDRILLDDLEIDRIHEVLNYSAMKQRGQRRGSHLGIIGRYIKEDDEHHETVTNFDVVILDTSIHKFLGHLNDLSMKDTTVLQIHEFAVAPTRSIALQDTVIVPIKYIACITNSIRQLKKNASQNDPKVLMNLNKNLVRYGKAIGNESLANFHQGNFYYWAADSVKTLGDKEKLLIKAQQAYQKSIDSIPPDSIMIRCPFRHVPLYAYLNLAISHRKIIREFSEQKIKNGLDHNYQAADSIFQIVTHRYLNENEFKKLFDKELREDLKERQFQALDDRYDFYKNYWEYLAMLYWENNFNQPRKAMPGNFENIHQRYVESAKSLKQRLWDLATKTREQKKLFDTIKDDLESKEERFETWAQW